MSRALALFSVVMLLAGSAMAAGALGYSYTLPGETTLFSSTLMGITPVANTAATPGQWFTKQAGTEAAFTATGLNLDDKTLPWAAGAGYLLPETIDLANGPVAMYFTCSTPQTLNNPNWSFGGLYNNHVATTGADAVQIAGRGEPGPGRMGFQSYGTRWGSNGQCVTDVDPGWCYSIQNTDAMMPVSSYVTNELKAGRSLKMRCIGYQNPLDYTVTQQIQVWAPAQGNGQWIGLSPLTNVYQPTTTPKYFSSYVDQGSDADRAGQIDTIFFFGGADFGHTMSNGMKYTNLVITQGAYGDTDFDNSVTLTDYFAALANLDTNAPATIAGSGNQIELKYNPKTGQIWIDTNGLAINGYNLAWGAGGFVTSKQPASGPLAAAAGSAGSFQKSGTVFAELLTSGTFTGELYLGDFGKLQPTMTDAQALNWLVTRTGVNTASNGTTTYNFTGVIVPEPATMSLLVLGGLGLIARRRRAA